MPRHTSPDLRHRRSRTRPRGIFVSCAVLILQIRPSSCFTYARTSTHTHSRPRHRSRPAANKVAATPRPPSSSPGDLSSILPDYAARITPPSPPPCPFPILPSPYPLLPLPLPATTNRRFVSYHSTSSLLHLDQKLSHRVSCIL